MAREPLPRTREVRAGVSEHEPTRQTRGRETGGESIAAMDRPSRRGANKAAKAEAAAAQLKSLKEKGLKRFDTMEEAEDKAVYDVVSVRARRRLRDRGSRLAFASHRADRRARALRRESTSRARPRPCVSLTASNCWQPAYSPPSAPSTHPPTRRSPTRSTPRSSTSAARSTADSSSARTATSACNPPPRLATRRDAFKFDPRTPLPPRGVPT